MIKGIQKILSGMMCFTLVACATTSTNEVVEEKSEEMETATEEIETNNTYLSKEDIEIKEVIESNGDGFIFKYPG